MLDALRTGSRARFAITTIFFVNGVGFSSLFSRLPQIKSDLHLSDGELGLALLAGTVSLMIAQPLAGALAVRRGSANVTTASGFFYCVAFLLPVLAPSLPTLALAMVVLAIAAGSMDVSMNVQGVAVERELGRPILSSLHAAFSFGGLTGSASGALAAGLGVRPELHLAVIAVLAVVTIYAVHRSLLGPEADASPDGPLFARPTRALAGLGALAFCVLFAEGSVNDWSAVFLRDSVGSSAGVAAIGLAAFSLTMGFGRLAGDGLAVRFSTQRVLGVGGLLAALGMGLALAAPVPGFAIGGFALMGIGLAAAFPLVLAAAARQQSSANAGTAIAAVSTAGYGGLLAGPPSIGLISELADLRIALLLVVALCFSAVLLSRTTRGARAPA